MFQMNQFSHQVGLEIKGLKVMGKIIKRNIIYVFKNHHNPRT